MEGGEISNFIKVWVTTIVSLCYCYGLSKIIPKGFKRLLLLLPIVSLFFYLPLNLYSAHLGGVTAFFIAWLANFKLLLFAFGQGPLCSDPSISLLHFVAVSCLPIKLQAKPKPLKSQSNPQFIHPNPNGQNNENPSQKSHLNSSNKENPSQKAHQNGQNNENPSPKLYLNVENRENPSSKSKQNGQTDQNNENPSPKLHINGENTENPSQLNGQNGKISEIQSPTKNNQMTRRKSKEWPTNYAMKGALLAVLAKVYDYNDYYHPIIISLLYQLHMYLLLELILAMIATMARRFLGLELEPQFKEPYLATSLQDFWGRRWNLTVTSIMRPIVFEPTLKLCSRYVGKKTALLAAVFNTFVVSGAMHELMYYYLGRSTPTGYVTFYFWLNGIALVAEIGLKIAFHGSGFVIPPLISRPLTLCFNVGTAIWLVLPEIKRTGVDVRVFEEYAAIGALTKVVGEKIAAAFR